MNIIGCFIGPLGSGKTYSAAKMCEIRDKYFSIDNTVFNAEQFWVAMRQDGAERWTLWDEPNRGLSNRRWYEELNQTITEFIQTGTRYRGKHILFALPAFELLDKNVRRVTLFEAKMLKPGLSEIYKLEPNRFGSPEFWKPLMGQFQSWMPKKAWVNGYGTKREAFHDTDYPEQLTEQQSKTRSQIEVERVMELVKKEPSRYLGKQGTSGKPVLNTQKIMTFADTNERTATRVRLKLEEEFASEK